MVSIKHSIFVFLLLSAICNSQVMNPSSFKDKMFTTVITGALTPLEPNSCTYSELWHLPIEIYEICMMKTRHQFLPAGMPST